jgi:hypothetical protein
MLNMNANSLNIPKVSFMLAGWGLVILLGGIINQWFGLNADATLWLWAGVSLLGLLAQLAAMVRGLGLNLVAWLAAIAIGWGFTYYVTKFDGGSHADLYGDLAGVWLILLGLGYVATAFQVDKRFLALAGLHLLVGALMELSIHQIVPVEVLDSYAALVFGVVGGLPLLAAGLLELPRVARVAPPQGVEMSRL